MGKLTGHTITNDSALGSAVIQRSIRFNPVDNQNLTRTSSSTSTTFTYSAWIKRSSFSGYQYIFSMAGKGFSFHTNNQTLYLYDGSALNESTAKFRDSSAWYHIVVQINSGVATSYVNGVLTHNAVGSGFTLTTGTNATRIGSYSENEYDFGGYMAEIHLVDGSVVAPTSFGFTDPVTGIWMPKRYEGTYGTDGFYLDFSDNSSTAALGIDKSPNGNDFAVNNFSVSAGAGNDSLEDTPTNNFSTMNPLVPSPSVTWANGNLDLSGSSGTQYSQNNTSTFGVSSGKWYVEVKYTFGGTTNTYVGICPTKYEADTNMTGSITDAAVLRMSNETYIEGSDTASVFASGISSGDIIGIALDMDNQKVWFSVQGTYANSGNPATGANAIFSGITAGETMAICARPLNGTLNFNFGQRPFSYTPPTGFKTLCSANLPPTTPSIVRPQKHFQPLLYTGQNTSSLYDVTGLEFAPDFVWAKARNDTIGHIFIDTVRGDDKQLEGNLSNAEVTRGTPSYRFLKDGFAVSTGGNMNNPVNYVAFCWKAGGTAVSNTDGSITSSVSANTEAGFSIVTFSITSDAVYTVGHGLGKAPQWIMMKARNTTNNWDCYHVSVGNTKRLLLNTNDTPQDYTEPWNDTTPTSSVFTSTGSWLGGSGTNCVAYCWTEIPGYSKFGTYTGNGSSDGTYVHLGFRPALVIFKSTSASENWQMKNSKQIGYNDQNHSFFCNNENVEYTTAQMDFLSNGFKLRNGGGGSNGSDETLVYMAWAEEPGTTPFDTVTNAR